MDKFVPDALKVRQLVNKATQDDETPTPGYLYNELAKFTQSANSCPEVEDLLLSRCEKKSSHVRLKALRVIKMLCERGSPSFKRDMQRKTNAIRSCLQFQGPVHPTLGDLPNRAVRDAAQEAMNAVFDTEVQQKPAESSISAQGFGMNNSSQSSQQQGVSSSGGAMVQNGKYTGYGNPNYTQQQSNSKMDERMEAMKAGASKLKDSFSEKMGVLSKKISDKVDEIRRDGQSSGSGGLYQGASSNSNPFAITSSGGGGGSAYTVGYSVQQSSAYSPAAVGSNQGTAAAVAQMNASPSRAVPAREVTGEHESKVVDGICAPGGMRAAPTKQELREFAQRVANLDLDTVVKLLVQKFSSNQWQSKLRALHCSECLLSNPQTGSDTAASIQGSLSSIQALENSPQSSVKDMAKKVFQLASQHQGSQGQVSSGSNDLLDFGNSSSSQAASSNPAGGDDLDDMFSGMSMHGAANQTAAPIAPAQQSNGAIGDLMGSVSPMTSASQEVPSQAAPLASESSFSFLSDTTSPAVQQSSQPSAAPSMLSELEMELSGPTNSSMTFRPGLPDMGSPAQGTSTSMPQQTSQQQSSAFGFVQNSVVPQKDAFDFVSAKVSQERRAGRK